MPNANASDVLSLVSYSIGTQCGGLMAFIKSVVGSRVG